LGIVVFNAVKITEGHGNFFTPLRILFAYLVLLGHAFVVVRGGDHTEPHIFYQFTMSYIAVNLFFIASGFLVSASMMYRKAPADFISARVLRIFPALAVHVLLIMFIFGPLTTNLGLWEYLANPQTLLQPVLVLSFVETHMYLPGIVPNNHEQIASASLWTLRYEVLAYIGTFIAFSVGFMRHRWMLAAQFVFFAVAFPLSMYTGLYDTLPATFRSLLRFGMCYGLGATFYAYRKDINFRAVVIPVLLAVTALSHNSVLFEVFFTVTLGYALFWGAYVKAPKLEFLQKLSDISYGIYIYHWAVLQAVFHFMPQISVAGLILISTPITLILASLSWNIVEKPALKLKANFAERLKVTKVKPVLNT
jgi:peptidoglycan/LPS O-acetylase OafA/YrhL